MPELPRPAATLAATAGAADVEPWTRGIAQAFGALAGGDRTQETARSAEELRLIRAKSARALMDKRVSDAAIRAGVLQSRNDAAPLLTDPRIRALVLGELGSDFSATQKGLGYEQQNDARGLGLEIAKAFASGQGELNPDALNALTAVAGDKLLSPSNVLVTPQAQGAVDFKTAQAGASNAAAEASLARAALSGAQQAQVAPKAVAAIAADNALAAEREAKRQSRRGFGERILETLQRATGANAKTDPEAPGYVIEPPARDGNPPSEADKQARIMGSPASAHPQAEGDVAKRAREAMLGQPEGADPPKPKDAEAALDPDDKADLANARAFMQQKGRNVIEAALQKAGKAHLIPLL